MSDSTAEARERPWRRMVLATLVFLAIIFAIAFWSQREDSLRLTDEELESTEVTTPP